MNNDKIKKIHLLMETIERSFALVYTDPQKENIPGMTRDVDVGVDPKGGVYVTFRGGSPTVLLQVCLEKGPWWTFGGGKATFTMLDREPVEVALDRHGFVLLRERLLTAAKVAKGFLREPSEWSVAEVEA